MSLTLAYFPQQQSLVTQQLEAIQGEKPGLEW